MKILAVATDNFEFYYNVVRELKQRDISFVSLSPTDPIASNIGVVITTSLEAEAIDHPHVIPGDDDIRMAVRRALSTLSGKSAYECLVVGIDPGIRPGVALLGDGKLLETDYASNPETVRDIVERYMEGYEFQKMIIRVGHGDKTNRNRTINALRSIATTIEIVNEESTTGKGGSPDLEAARRIALSQGELAEGDFVVEATEGEKKEIQRRSRIKSGGDVTISKELAKKVVEGELKLPDAIKKQKENKEKNQ